MYTDANYKEALSQTRRKVKNNASGYVLASVCMTCIQAVVE